MLCAVQGDTVQDPDEQELEKAFWKAVPVSVYK